MHGLPCLPACFFAPVFPLSSDLPPRYYYGVFTPLDAGVSVDIDANPPPKYATIKA